MTAPPPVPPLLQLAPVQALVFIIMWICKIWSDYYCRCVSKFWIKKAKSKKHSARKYGKARQHLVCPSPGLVTVSGHMITVVLPLHWHWTLSLLLTNAKSSPAWEGKFSLQMQPFTLHFCSNWWPHLLLPGFNFTLFKLYQHEMKILNVVEFNYFSITLFHFNFNPNFRCIWQKDANWC